MKEIMQQKISADHLLYVSLKYTKTTDVILNLLARWSELIESSIEKLLKKAKKDGEIDEIPSAVKPKIDKSKEIYDEEEIVNAIELYDFMRKIETLNKTREHEFRKNVALNVRYKGKWTRIDLEKLKDEYSKIMDEFIKKLRTILD